MEKQKLFMLFGGCLLAAALPAQTTDSGSMPSGGPVSVTACVTQESIASWDAAAKLIAGISAGDYANEFTGEQQTAWNEYAKTAAADWGRLRRRYVDRITAWNGRYLKDAPSTGVVFYPFSGPDATSPLAFFPGAREYVLVGLEPAGCIPAHSEAFVPEYWPALRQGWQSATVLGFFKTEDMKHDLTESAAGGVLPVLLFLIARAGNSIVDVAHTGITSSGAVVALAETPEPRTIEIHGVTIRFRDALHGERTLRYFAANLQNPRLARRPGTTKYLDSLPPGGTLIKSASYLLHRKFFSQVRAMILARSTVVIQDDSGVPYRLFDPESWDVRLFGTYDKPIDLFKDWAQEDLAAAYQSADGVQPLDFGISYKWRPGESNLLVAVRLAK